MTPRRYTCRTVRNMLPLHVGRDLDPRHVAAVDEHLGRCLSCFREFHVLADVRGRLGVLAEEPLPAGILDGFTEEVMARIAVGEPGPAAAVLRPRTPWWSRPSLAAAAALLLVATAAWRWFDGQDALQRAARPAEVRSTRPLLVEGPSPALFEEPLAPPSAAAPGGQTEDDLLRGLRPTPGAAPLAGLPAVPRALPGAAGFGAQPVGAGVLPVPPASVGPGAALPHAHDHGLRGIRIIVPVRLPTPAEQMLLQRGDQALRAALLSADPDEQGLVVDESGRQRRPRQP